MKNAENKKKKYSGTHLTTKQEEDTDEVILFDVVIYQIVVLVAC